MRVFPECLYASHTRTFQNFWKSYAIMYRMKQPIMPPTPASETPELWDIFWEQNRLYEKHLENVKYADYRRDYYKKRTEERQIKKMHELMDKYPAEARSHVYD